MGREMIRATLMSLLLIPGVLGAADMRFPSVPQNPSDSRSANQKWVVNVATNAIADVVVPLDNRVTTAEGTLSTATNNIKVLQTTVNTATNDIRQLKITLNTATNDIRVIQSTLNTATNDIQRLTTTQSDATNRLSIAEKTLTTATNDVRILYSEVGTLTNRVDQHEDSLSAVEQLHQGDMKVEATARAQSDVTLMQSAKSENDTRAFLVQHLQTLLHSEVEDRIAADSELQVLIEVERRKRERAIQEVLRVIDEISNRPFLRVDGDMIYVVEPGKGK